MKRIQLTEIYWCFSCFCCTYDQIWAFCNQRSRCDARVKKEVIVIIAMDFLGRDVVVEMYSLEIILTQNSQN